MFGSRNAKLAMGVAVAATLAATTAARASSIVANGGFEDPLVSVPFTTLTAGSGGLTGWTIEAGSLNVGAGGSVDHIGSLWQPAEGSQSIDLDGSPGYSDESAKISQVLNTVNGQWYQLTFSMSGNPGGAPPLKTMQVLLNDSAVGSPYTYDTSVTLNSLADMKWESHTLLFQATGTTKLTFDSSVYGWYGPALDNVSVQAVPVPASVWGGMMLLGGLGAAQWLRRHRVA